jgi:hypothetical protein
MKSNTPNNERLEFVVRAKISYRRDAQAMSWEEKIASIERMKKASEIIKSAAQSSDGIAKK